LRKRPDPLLPCSVRPVFQRTPMKPADPDDALSHANVPDPVGQHEK
jgi:hypothetical protein